MIGIRQFTMFVLNDQIYYRILRQYQNISIDLHIVLFVFLRMQAIIEDNTIFEISLNDVPYLKIDRLSFKKIEMVEDRVKMNVDVKFQNLAPEVEYKIQRTYSDIAELFSKIPQTHKFIFITPSLPPAQSIIFDTWKKLKNKFGSDSAQRQAIFKDYQNKFKFKYIKRSLQLLTSKTIIKNLYTNSVKSQSPLFIFIDKKYTLYRHRQATKESTGTLEYLGGFFKGSGNKIIGMFNSKNAPVYKNPLLQTLKTDLLASEQRYKMLAHKMFDYWHNLHDLCDDIHTLKKQIQEKSHSIYLVYIQLEFICRQIRFIIDQVESMIKKIQGIPPTENMQIMGDQFKQYDSFVRKQTKDVEQHFQALEKKCLEVLMIGGKKIKVSIGSLYENYKKVQNE